MACQHDANLVLWNQLFYSTKGSIIVMSPGQYCDETS